MTVLTDKLSTSSRRENSPCPWTCTHRASPPKPQGRPVRGAVIQLILCAVLVWAAQDTAGTNLRPARRAAGRSCFSGCPIHRVLFEVGVDGGAHRWIKVRSSETLEQFEALQLVLDRVFHFRKSHLDSRFA